jgi:hypothetical protein
MEELGAKELAEGFTGHESQVTSHESRTYGSGSPGVATMPAIRNIS